MPITSISDCVGILTKDPQTVKEILYIFGHFINFFNVLRFMLFSWIFLGRDARKNRAGFNHMDFIKFKRDVK
jgi:hypothetical protein